MAKSTAVVLVALGCALCLGNSRSRPWRAAQQLGGRRLGGAEGFPNRRRARQSLRTVLRPMGSFPRGVRGV
jgi:hypothetical protein